MNRLRHENYKNENSETKYLKRLKIKKGPFAKNLV